MFFGHICLYWVEPMVTSFFLTKADSLWQSWQSTHSVNLNCLGYSSSVSGVPQGRDRRNSGFSFPFLVAPLALLYPQIIFPFLFIDSKSDCCPPCPLTLLFIPPSLHPLSTFGGSVAEWGSGAHLPSEEDSQGIDLSQRWISAFQQQTPSIPEGNRNWFSPYLGAALPNTQFPVLPKTFHRGLINAGEFLTKYLLTTISYY